MRPTLALLSITTLFAQASAQTPVDHTSYAFSTGVYPTFSVTFENTDPKTVENWWKDVLKDMSENVSSKKEVIAMGARLPQVSSDTIAILLKAVQPKKLNFVTAYLAFRVNNAFVGVDSGERQVQGCKDFVYAKAVAFKKEVAQGLLTVQTRKLAELQDQHAALVKEKERSENSLKKNQDKAVEAGQEKIQEEAELKNAEMAVASMQQQVAASPSEENTAKLNDLVKQQAKWKDKLERSTTAEKNAREKMTGLDQDIKDNLRAQEEKTKAIAAQQKIVDELAAKLAAIN